MRVPSRHDVLVMNGPLLRNVAFSMLKLESLEVMRCMKISLRSNIFWKTLIHMGRQLLPQVPI